MSRGSVAADVIGSSVEVDEPLMAAGMDRGFMGDCMQVSNLEYFPFFFDTFGRITFIKKVVFQDLKGTYPSFWSQLPFGKPFRW